MGDAKDSSPKKILKCDMDLEMRDAKGCSPILGEENDIYPLTAMLSVNVLDPHYPNVSLTLTVQWVGMDGFPKLVPFLLFYKFKHGTMDLEH